MVSHVDVMISSDDQPQQLNARFWPLWFQPHVYDQGCGFLMRVKSGL